MISQQEWTLDFNLYFKSLQKIANKKKQIDHYKEIAKRQDSETKYKNARAPKICSARSTE